MPTTPADADTERTPPDDTADRRAHDAATLRRLTASGWRWLHSYAGVRILAFAAALLFTLAVWEPWAFVPTSYSFDGTHFTDIRYGGIDSFIILLRLIHSSSSAQASPSQSIALSRLFASFQFAWLAFPPLATLLAPWLWLHSRSRAWRIMRIIWTLWLLLATLSVATLIRYVFVTSWFPFYISPSNALQPFMPHPHITLGVGVWIALLALAIGWWSTGILYREGRAPATAPHSAPTAPAPLSPRLVSWRRAGIALETLGIAVWAVGYLTIPWATVNCPTTPIALNHFVVGRCAGLDAGDALAAGSMAHGAFANSSWLYSLFGMLLGGAALLIPVVWRRPLARITLGWLSVWLLSVTIAAIASLRGVNVILATNPILTSATAGQWVGAVGSTITLLGLLLCWLGVILLEQVALRH